MQLAMPDVDAGDASGAARNEHMGEAAGRGADVETGAVLRIDGEGVERAGFAFMGFDIPHAHAHVLPVFERDDITSRRAIAEEKITYRPPPRAEDGELAATVARLRAALG